MGFVLTTGCELLAKLIILINSLRLVMKWESFCKGHIQIHCSYCSIAIPISLKFIPRCPINNIVSQTGTKPLAEPNSVPHKVLCTYKTQTQVINVWIHWGRVTHICVGKLTIIGSDNGLSPGRHQAITWTNAGILLIGPLGTNFSKTLIRMQIFPFMKMHLKMLFAKWRPFCLSLNVLTPDGTRSSVGIALNEDLSSSLFANYTVLFLWTG